MGRGRQTRNYSGAGVQVLPFPDAQARAASGVVLPYTASVSHLREAVARAKPVGPRPGPGSLAGGPCSPRDGKAARSGGCSGTQGPATPPGPGMRKELWERPSPSAQTVLTSWPRFNRSPGLPGPPSTSSEGPCLRHWAHTAWPVLGAHLTPSSRLTSETGISEAFPQAAPSPAKAQCPQSDTPIPPWPWTPCS